MLKQALRSPARVGLHLVAAGAVMLVLVPDAGAASVNVGTVITAGAIQLARQTTEDALAHAQAATATSQIIPDVAQSGVIQTLGAANATSTSATGAAAVAPVASSPTRPHPPTRVSSHNHASQRRVARRARRVRSVAPTSARRALRTVPPATADTWASASLNLRSSTSGRPAATRSSLGGRTSRRSSTSPASEPRPPAAVAVPESVSGLPATGSVTGAAGGGSGAGPAIAVLLAFTLLLVQVLLAGRLSLDVLPWHSALARRPPERPG